MKTAPAEPVARQVPRQAGLTVRLYAVRSHAASFRRGGPSGPPASCRRLRRRMAAAALVLALATVLAPPAAAEYRTVDVEGLRITIDSDWPMLATTGGYLPFRFDITNLGDDRVIEVVGSGQQSYRMLSGYTTANLTVRRTLRLPRAARAQFTMDVPLSGDTHVTFQVLENGRTVERFGFTGIGRTNQSPAVIVVAPGGTYASLAAGWLRERGFAPAGIPIVAYGTTVVATGAGAAPAAGRTAAPPGPSGTATRSPAPKPAPLPAPGIAGTPVAPSGGPGPSPSGPRLDIMLEPQRLPSSWLGYTSLEAVVIGPKEWEALDRDRRTALLTWIAAGGQLMLVDAGLELLFPDPDDRPELDSTNATRYFLGNIYLRESAAVDADLFGTTLHNALTSVTNRGWALPAAEGPDTGSPAATGFRLPIPGVEAVPARAYLAILVLFAVLIGPVNHVLLKRWRQQSLVVLTTPLIAAAFIAVLGSYVILVEGFGVRGRAVSFTVLDQFRSQAATRAIISLYAAGRAPSGGLQFPRDVAVLLPTPSPTSPWADRHLDLTDGQRFAAGLLQARTPSNFETVAVRTARERINIRRDGGRLTAVNGLDATVTRLRYKTGGTTYVATGPLAAGGTAALQPGDLPADDLAPAEDAGAFGDEAASQPDGTYLAVLDRSPFVETGLTDLDESGSFHLVLGRVAGTP